MNRVMRGRRGKEAETETETCEGTRPGGTEKAEREQSDTVEQPWAVCEMPGDGSGQLQCARACKWLCVPSIIFIKACVTTWIIVQKGGDEETPSSSLHCLLHIIFSLPFQSLHLGLSLTQRMW